MNKVTRTYINKHIELELSYILVLAHR